MPKRNDWTTGEQRLLRTMWLDGSIPLRVINASFPGRSEHSLAYQAKQMRLRRPERGIMSTGDPLLDAIRKRATTRNVTMRELDDECHSGSYWRVGCKTAHGGGDRYKVRRSSTFIARAVAFLDGELTVMWHS